MRVVDPISRIKVRPFDIQIVALGDCLFGARRSDAVLPTILEVDGPIIIRPHR
ncbi:hypothetical protein PP613_21925 [Mycobacteroides abscessus]|nr:hypothetical protein [Mycobacteroides abscessus]MDM2412031.1 hypothetical protein [Mycobacteroides abscessus]